MLGEEKVEVMALYVQKNLKVLKTQKKVKINWT
jgi:hypothetical protein